MTDHAVSATDQEHNEQLRGVIERHIDRFAFREAPLACEWHQTKDIGQ